MGSGEKREIALHTKRGLPIKGQPPFALLEVPQQTRKSLRKGMARESGLSGHRRFSG